MQDIAGGVRGKSLDWEDLCKDPNLQDLPYKIETNERGQIVMSPTYFYHGGFQYRIARLLEEHLPEGRSTVESAVQTTKGTKVPDTAWLTAERWEEVKDACDAPIAPEIYVEVLSPSNTTDEIEEKKQLYFAAGAEEVWLCNEEGRMQFFDADGRLDTSRRAPDFPAQIHL